jgi:hypothetical protein
MILARERTTRLGSGSRDLFDLKKGLHPRGRKRVVAVILSFPLRVGVGSLRAGSKDRSRPECMLHVNRQRWPP